MAKLKNTLFSNVICKGKGCKRKIKQRLRNKEKPYTLCYKCYCVEEAKKGHFIGHLGKGRSVKKEEKKNDKTTD